MSSNMFQVDRMQLVSTPGPLRAFVSIKIADAVIVHKIKVIEGSKGLFVAMPSEKGKGEGGEDKYFDTVFPIKKEAREELIKVVLDAYHAKVKGQANP